MTTQERPRAGRANQKERTRVAILAATRELIMGSGEVTMPLVARAALVSEATAYRYFPDLVSLLREAVEAQCPRPNEIMALIAHLDDPVERVAHVTEALLRHAYRYQAAVRAMMSAAITRPDSADQRPGARFGLIDAALAPLTNTLGRNNPEALGQLKLDLAVIMSAEALFTLTDLCGLSPDAAVAGVVRTARTLTSAACAAQVDRPEP